MNTKTLIHSILTAGSILAVTAVQAADDHTIDSGAAEELAANAVYAKLTVNGSLTLAENVVVTAATLTCSLDATQPEGVLTLKSGARLVTTDPWTMNGSGTFRTRFEGGTISFRQIQRFDKGTNIFEAVNGNNINLDINGTLSPVFKYATNDPRILFTGNGGLVKTGNNGTLMNDYHYNKVIVMDYTGETWITSGICHLQGCNFPALTPLHVASEAALALNGNIVNLGSFDGDGYMIDADYNRSYVTFGGNGDSNLTALDTIGTRLVKNGTGTMILAPRESMSFLTLNQGKVIMKSRAEAGYRTYRFKVDECRGPGSSWDATQVGEFYLFDPSGKEITNLRNTNIKTTYNNGWIECLFDRKAGTKWFSGVKYNSSDTDKANCFVDVGFPKIQPVAAYRWGTANDCKWRDPSAWRIQARMYLDASWKTFATITNFSANATRDADAIATNFVLNLPRRVTVPTITVAAGTTLEVNGNTELYTTNLVQGSFCSINLTNGGSLILDPQKDQVLSFARLAGNGELRKEGTKKLTLNGAASNLTGAIHVAGGTLKMSADRVVQPKAFKFTFTKNTWIVNNPSGDWTKNLDYRTIQFGELALYDDHLNRINLSANLAYCSNNSSAGALFDGDTTSSCYYTAIPTTPYEVVIELNANVTAPVTSYRFHQETKWSGVNEKTPGEWTVSVAETRSGPWTVVDQRTCPCANTKNWNAWQGGVPFTFTTNTPATGPAFAATCPVQIDAGATLDVADGETVIADLTVDCSATDDATLVGGTLAETGRLTLIGLTDSAREVTLPLVLDGTTLPASFAGWTLLTPGSKRQWHLEVRNGRLVVSRKFSYLILR